MSEPARSFDDVARTAEDYYDSPDADAFYFEVWGGEDIHIGLYDTTDDIAEAGRLIIEKMAGLIDPPLGPGTRVMDLGAGYGGAARALARRFGCHVTCLNISETQNATNRRLNEEQGLSELVAVHHGSFEDVPEPDAAFDVVWAQDALLHAGNREQVLREAFRTLRPGGHFVYTDPMQDDDVPEGVLQPVYDRIHLPDLGSFAFYRAAADRVGFEVADMLDLSVQLGRHYARVKDVLETNRDRLSARISEDYISRMGAGLQLWVDAQRAGHLRWGIIHFRKPV